MKKYLIILTGVLCSVVVASDSDRELGENDPVHLLPGGSKKTISDFNLKDLESTDEDLEELSEILMKEDSLTENGRGNIGNAAQNATIFDPNRDTSRDGWMQFG